MKKLWNTIQGVFTIRGTVMKSFYSVIAMLLVAHLIYGYGQNNTNQQEIITQSSTTTSSDKISTSGKQIPGFIFVQGGSFTMGDTRGKGCEDELPTHIDTLNSFYIGKFEVTQKEFSKYMAPDIKPDTTWTIKYGLGANYPAYNVSWYAILKYCNLRSVKEELAPCYRIGGSTNPNDWGSIPTFKDSIWDAVICDWNANGYRLPTEAEWEYAARGATNEPDYLYSGSDKIEYVAWYLDNSEDTSHPVGEKKDNSIGIYDMSGNIWEWCWDRYSDSYYRSSPRNNPVGPSSGLSRVFRGGGWNYNASLCRVANRADGAPYESYIFVGFRVCRSAP